MISLPAAVATWSGWVGLGQMTGFGKVRLLPGIWDELKLNTAVTLPIGVEAYAAFALSAALTSAPVSDETRRFAWWSAGCALALGMGAQVAYHLLQNDGRTTAPWQITTAVSCLPVLVLGLGAVLAHMLHRDRTAAAGVVDQVPIPDTSGEVSEVSEDPPVEVAGATLADADLGHPEQDPSEVSDAGQRVRSLDEAIRAAKADGMTVREIVEAFHPVKKWRVEKALYPDSRSDSPDSPTEMPEIAVPEAAEESLPEPAQHTSNGHVPALTAGDWS